MYLYAYYLKEDVLQRDRIDVEPMSLLYGPPVYCYNFREHAPTGLLSYLVLEPRRLKNVLQDGFCIISESDIATPLCDKDDVYGGILLKEENDTMAKQAMIHATETAFHDYCREADSRKNKLVAAVKAWRHV